MSEMRSEEEQVEAIKKWWADNGKSVVAGIAIGLSGLFGWQWWGDHQKHQNEQSSAYYQQLSVAIIQKNEDGIDQLFSVLQKQAPNSAYLVFSAMDVAKLKLQNDDFEGARLYLKRAVDGAPDEGLAAIARLRLARVLLQLGELDDAMTAITTSIPAEMQAQAAEIRGDIELARGNKKAARAAYTEALAGEVANADIVKMKLDDLGAAKAS